MGKFTGEKLLPEKADLGNLRRESGTVPVRLLLDKSNNRRLGILRSGNSPESELLARFRAVKRVKFEIEEGTVPLKLLFDKSIIERFFQTEKSNGNDP